MIPVLKTIDVLGSQYKLPGSLVCKEEVLTSHSESKASYHVIIRLFNQNGAEVLIKDFETCGSIGRAVDMSLGSDIVVQVKSKGAGISKSFIDLGIYNKDRAFRLAFSTKATGPYRPLVTQNIRASTERDILVEILAVPSKKSTITPLEFQLIPSASTVYTHPNSGTLTNTSSSIRCHIPSTVLKFVQEVTSTLSGAQRCINQHRITTLTKRPQLFNFPSTDHLLFIV